MLCCRYLKTVYNLSSIRAIHQIWDDDLGDFVGMFYEKYYICNSVTWVLSEWYIEIGG